MRSKSNKKFSDADSEAAETIKQAQSERAKGIQNLQDQLKEAKIMQDKERDEKTLPIWSIKNNLKLK